MKKTSLVLLIVMLLLSVSGCKKTDESNTENKNGEETAIGFVYSDKQIGVFVFIKNADWTYSVDREIGQVYFYNKDDSSGINMISISSVEKSGDGSQQIMESWESMKANYLAADFIIDEQTEITIGEGYQGYQHDFTAIFEGIPITGSCIMWSSEGRVYIMTTSSDEKAFAEVKSVFDGIVDSFHSDDE